MLSFDASVCTFFLTNGIMFSTIRNILVGGLFKYLLFFCLILFFSV